MPIPQTNQPFNLNALTDINSYVDLASKLEPNTLNPEVFYSRILLDTIRYGEDQFVYYRLADESPIQDKADKLVIRRWAPLQGHTIPLDEGIPPKSDRGSAEKYELQANQYGRYMEFTDKVSFKVVDPMIAHYAKEYSIVAIETLDMLAREVLFSIAQQFYANGAINFEALTIDSQPNLTDLRIIVLTLQKQLVKPRSNGRYHVIAGPDFYFDMVSDPTVEKYMRYNQTTKSMYEDSKLIPLFGMEFYETLIAPTSSDFVSNGVRAKRMYRPTADGNYEYMTVLATDENANVHYIDGYVQDRRTGQDASYIPHQEIWDLEAWNAAWKEANNDEGADWTEFKVQHVLVVGKDALTRTGLTGEGQTKMYTKPLGSSGVLDPIDQRQSIGFKINSVGFGSTRLEAVVDYMCVPTQTNIV